MRAPGDGLHHTSGTMPAANGSSFALMTSWFCSVIVGGEYTSAHGHHVSSIHWLEDEHANLTAQVAYVEIRPLKNTVPQIWARRTPLRLQEPDARYYVSLPEVTDDQSLNFLQQESVPRSICWTHQKLHSLAAIL